jgi:hypothetical protein
MGINAEIDSRIQEEDGKRTWDYVPPHLPVKKELVRAGLWKAARFFGIRWPFGSIDGLQKTIKQEGHDFVGDFEWQDMGWHVATASGPAFGKNHNGDRVKVLMSSHELSVYALDGVAAGAEVNIQLKQRLSKFSIHGQSDQLLPEVVVRWPSVVTYSIDRVLGFKKYSYPGNGNLGESVGTQHQDFSELTKIIEKAREPVRPWIRMNALAGWMMAEKMLGITGIDAATIPAVTGAIVGIIHKETEPEVVNISAIADARVFVVYKIDGKLWAQEQSTPRNGPFDATTLGVLEMTEKSFGITRAAALKKLMDEGYFQEGYNHKRNRIGGTPVCDATAAFMSVANINTMNNDARQIIGDDSLVGVAIFGDGAVAQLQEEHGLNRMELAKLIKRVLMGENLGQVVKEIREQHAKGTDYLQKPDDITVASLVKSARRGEIKEMELKLF